MFKIRRVDSLLLGRNYCTGINKLINTSLVDTTSIYLKIRLFKQTPVLPKLASREGWRIFNFYRDMLTAFSASVCIGFGADCFVQDKHFLLEILLTVANGKQEAATIDLTYFLYYSL